MTSETILTPWFSPWSGPVRDGVYLVRKPGAECWHACRWHGRTRSWYSAGTTGTDQGDVIGWDRPNQGTYEWRGLSFNPRAGETA